MSIELNKIIVLPEKLDPKEKGITLYWAGFRAGKNCYHDLMKEKKVGLNTQKLEKVLFPYLRGLLSRTLAYHGKKVTEWDITGCDNVQEELAIALADNIDKVVVESKEE